MKTISYHDLKSLKSNSDLYVIRFTNFEEVKSSDRYEFIPTNTVGTRLQICRYIESMSSYMVNDSEESESVEEAIKTIERDNEIYKYTDFMLYSEYGREEKVKLVNLLMVGEQYRSLEIDGEAWAYASDFCKEFQVNEE